MNEIEKTTEEPKSEELLNQVDKEANQITKDMLLKLLEQVIQGKVSFYNRTVRRNTNTSACVNLPLSNIGKNTIITVFEE